MADEAAVGEESDISDFEIDDEIKEELNSLMNLEFIQTSSEDDDAEEEKDEPEKEPEKEDDRQPRGDSLERELEMMFMSQHVNKEVPGGGEEGASKDTGLESISDNELDGPESGECDTSDGELPDSPNIVVTVPDTPPINHMQDVEDLSGSSDVELVEEYQGRDREYYETPQNPTREVIIESKESVPKKKDKSPSKSKDKSIEKVKKDKKDKSKKKSESDVGDDEKRRMKLEKYMARLEMYKSKCREYMKQITKKYDYMKKAEKSKIKAEKNRIKNVSPGESSKLKSIVKEVNRDISPQSSTSSKFDRSSHSSKTDKYSHPSASDDHGKRSSSERERKSKHKKSKSKSKELKEHKLLYQEYLHYLQLEREKCLEEGISMTEKPKKPKKRKSKSKSPDKRKEIPVSDKKVPRPPILSFSEFCNNRELVSPDREILKTPIKVKTSHDTEARKERTISIDSAATTVTVRSDPVDPTDEDKDLFITITDLVEQDKLRKEKSILEKDKEKIETELEKDPELKSISVFTSVLFKGGADSEGIPFLSSECRPNSPKLAEIKPKKPFIQDTGIDEIYDMNNDLSNISQSSLSPSRSPVPKLHNKALLNYLENQKERLVNKSPDKNSKSSRSRSKSPRREKSKSKKRKRKHHSSISTVSPSPPPLRPRSPENTLRKKPSPPAYLKERWKDYPSPPEHRLARREHRLPRLSRRRSRSRTRKVHHSRSSSEERERHYRHYRSSRSRSRSPPELTMVQLTATEKRRKLREDHERALASLRETIRKPLSNTPLSITITNHGDNYEAIRDNYDPVGMNEDSSSNSPSEVEVITEKVNVSAPSLPPLPPEPPPPKPAPPSAEKREDLTVVTTYTSFVPLPNTNMAPPPIGYDFQMPSFGGWMPPVGDMQHPNVMFPPPQMMNNFNTPPPQQHFPFMNQPPPPLPHQMTMPPPCHQHYRMPNQALPNVNIVSVRQEVKHVKSSPVVITQISDGFEDEHHNIHPLEGSKCKHNPLGQNNQTIQEAIDSVKKCLKNCDTSKNKDPRLALADGRKKSLEKSEPSAGFDDKKVKITLNYKPRPIKDVEQTCLFEPANDESDGKNSGPGESNKTTDDNYNEKNLKIEGIVSKLKDNFNTITDLTHDEAEKYDSCINLNKSIENKTSGDEPYDPFNLSDEISDNNTTIEDLKTNSEDKHNDSSQTVLLKDSTPKLSASEVENINDQINKSFAFILSHSIERKRLTPTLSNIVANKAEKQKKCELNDKFSPTTKLCEFNEEPQRNKNELTSLIKPSHELSSIRSNIFDQSVFKSDKIVNNPVNTAQSESKTNTDTSQEKVTDPHISSKSKKNKLAIIKSDKSGEIVSGKCSETKLDTNKQLKESEAFDLSCRKKFVNILESDCNISTSQPVIQNVEVQKQLSENEVKVCKAQHYIVNNYKNQNNFIQEENTANSDAICKKDNSHDKEEAEKLETELRHSHLLSGHRHSSEKHEFSLNTQSLNRCNDVTQSASENISKNTDCKRNEYSFGINIDLMEKQDSKKHGKLVFGESKPNYNSERRGHPPLSIPTKGELKRFPTPERSMSKSRKTEPNLEESDESKSQKKMFPRSKESRDNSGGSKINEEVGKAPSSNIVESILQDFDESNSISCDFKPLAREKNVNNDKTDTHVFRASSPIHDCDGLSVQISDAKDSSTFESCLLTSNKIPEETDIRDQVQTVNSEVFKLESRQSLSSDNRNIQQETCGLNLVKSNQYKDHPLKCLTSDDGVPMTGEFPDVSSAEKVLEEELSIPQEESKEISQDDDSLNEDEKGIIVRRSQRKHKISKSNITNDEDFSKCVSTETKNNSSDNEPPRNSLLIEDNCSMNQNGIPVVDTQKYQIDKLQNFLSTNPIVLLKSLKSNTKQFKPCPLSRKSKSYISQNLPLSFDLSVDGHLIRRGFKKLRVSLHKLAEQSTTARSSEPASLGISSSCLNVAKSDNDCCVDLVVESVSDICNKNNMHVKENTIQTTKEKKKKRVSFDLNVSEIFDDCKLSSDDEVSINTTSGSEPNYDEKDQCNDERDEIVKYGNGNLILEDTSNHTALGTNKAEETDISNTHTSLSDCDVAEAVDKCTDEKQSDSLSYFYQGLAKTLASLRGSSMPQLYKRKTVILNIPKSEDMPAAKILKSLKKTSKAKKPALQETLEDVHGHSKSIKTDVGSCKTEPSKLKNVNKNDTSKKGSIETWKNKSCNSSEVLESDNDDSMILDRELSDLAKGCLDSDSNVGEDDDSVLNFGIAASDDSSVDSDLDINHKNTLLKLSTCRQKKLASPLNNKRRFMKKLKSINADLDLKVNKKTESQMASREENKLTSRDLRQSQKSTVESDEAPLCEDTENNTKLEFLSDQISLNKLKEGNKELIGSKEIGVPTSSKRKVYDARFSDVTITKDGKQNETIRRTSKRQKDKSKRPLVISEDGPGENPANDKSITSKNITSVRKNKQNYDNTGDSNLHLNPEENEEIILQKDTAGLLSNHDCKDGTKENENSNNVSTEHDKSKSVDSEKESASQNNGLYTNSKEIYDIAFNVDLKSTPDRNLRNIKSTQKNNAVKSDIIEHKWSSIRKTRGRKLCEQQVSEQVQHANSEEIVTHLSETKTKEKVDISNIRKTRSGRLVDNDPLINVEEQTPPQGETKSQKDSSMKDIDNLYSDKETLHNYQEVKSPESNLEVKETLTEGNTETLLNNPSNPQILIRDRTHVEGNINNTPEAAKENVTDKQECVDKDLEGGENTNKTNVKIHLNNECEMYEPTQDNEKIKSCCKQKKEIKKLEDVSSTTLEITQTENVRKTRLSQRKKGVFVYKSKQTKIIDLVSVDNVISETKSEPPVRKTRRQQNIYELIEEKEKHKSEKDCKNEDEKHKSEKDCKNEDEKRKSENDFKNEEEKQNSENDQKNEEEKCQSENDSKNTKLTPEGEITKFETKKDELDLNKPHTIERTLSTESADEPLIIVKNKLLADKNKTKIEVPKCDYSESSPLLKNQSSVLQNEDIKYKCSSSVADGSANTSQGNLNDGNFSNGSKNTQGTRSNGNNESYSSNLSSNNSLSNTGHNNSSYLNINGISNSENSSNSSISISNNPTHMSQTLFTPLNSQSIYSSVIQQKCSMNPKLKEAMRKKRDKAEVDAEIKRRLAEIDELEKLARSQHANVLEKIGARTRSHTLTSGQSANIDEEEDVVSISSDDSQGTSVGTNEATNSGSKMVDVGKSEYLNEEPTTTQEDGMKTSLAPAHIEVAEKDTPTIGPSFKESVSILSVDTTQRAKKNKINETESGNNAKVENKTQRQTKNNLNDITKLCSQKPLLNNKNRNDTFNTHTQPINLTPHADKNATLEVDKMSVDADEQRLVLHNEMNDSAPISKQLRKDQRDIVSVYQFRESDESEPDEEIYPKQKYNRASRKIAEVGNHKNKITRTSLPLRKSQQLQEKSIRKTRRGPVVQDSFSDKCNSSSRESSPSNQITRKPCETAKHLNNQSNLTSTTNIIPEPDSSTSIIDIPSNRPGGIDTSGDGSKDSAIRLSSQGDETNPVVSSNNTSQELDMIPSSPVTGFKQPYRKSFANRKKRKRRSYFGRCLMPTNHSENTLNESFGDNNDHIITQSEEVVSSSVNTVQIPQDKKKRRRRKTVMDLLMEDSMLSVTRDFPMSPNPYMFSSFYKDVDLSSPNSKPNAANESPATELNAKKTNEDRGLPLKPDFLAQKLRILEKLKSISRKNRKTRQCRTLVCYNEDSLPESLVESPVGESVPNNGDGGSTSQESSAVISINENNGECSKKSFQEPAVISEVQFTTMRKDCVVSNFNLLPKEQNSCPPKTPLKRGRKSKVLKNLHENEEWEATTQSGTTTDVYIRTNLSDEKCSPSTLLETKYEGSTLEQNQRNTNVELSEFDKLLESKPKDSSRIKLPYDYNPRSPQSPSEDKSDDAPDDFFNSLPSPRQSSDDDSSASENSDEHQYLSSKCITGQKTHIINEGSTLNSSEHKIIRPGKIVCSILKTKIGKMLPYFGDTLSDFEDDDLLDEDIPLSIKLTQFTEKGNKDLRPNSEKEDGILTKSEVLNTFPLRNTAHPEYIRRRQKIRRPVPVSKIRKSARSTRSKSDNSDCDKIIATATWDENSKTKADILGESFNSDSLVQLRKSNRRLKTPNFISKETVDVMKPTSDEGPNDNQENETNDVSYLDSDTYVDLQDEPVSLKKKGRPSKIKLVRENNTDQVTSKPNEQLSAEIENFVEVEDCSNETSQHLHYTKRKDKFTKIGNEENCVKPTDNTTVYDMKADDDHSKSKMHPKSQEPPKLQLSDLDSAIQKSITLRRTRAKSGKEGLESETNTEEATDMEIQPENDIGDDPKEDYLLEDLPLNKRAARKPPLRRRRSRKENLPLENSGNFLSIDNSVDNIKGSHDTIEHSFSNNKDEIDLSVGNCFNDSPPPLIRTRTRRAKLITSENGYLDPPSLETSVPPNIDNDKDECDGSVNTDSNLDSTDTCLNEDTNLPPRKRGRKPKNSVARIYSKDEELFKTPKDVALKEPENIKMQETEDVVLRNSNLIEIQSLPKKRGKRGKRKITRRRTVQRFNMPNKNTDSDDDTEVEINIRGGISSSGDLHTENDQSEELESNISILGEDGGDITDNCSESADFFMQEDGRKKKRKLRDNKEDIKVTDSTPNVNSNTEKENNTEGDDSGIKKRKTEDRNQNAGNDSSYNEASGSNFTETHSYMAQSCANQPFLWNKISGFLNKTTRSVGTQVRVKNMILKGFETSEPEVSLQSELTLPQVIKTLFEELRFIDSTFSNP